MFSLFSLIGTFEVGIPFGPVESSHLHSPCANFIDEFHCISPGSTCFRNTLAHESRPTPPAGKVEDTTALALADLTVFPFEPLESPFLPLLSPLPLDFPLPLSVVEFSSSSFYILPSAHLSSGLFVHQVLHTLLTCDLPIHK